MYYLVALLKKEFEEKQLLVTNQQQEMEALQQKCDERKAQCDEAERKLNEVKNNNLNKMEHFLCKLGYVKLFFI